MQRPVPDAVPMVAGRKSQLPDLQGIYSGNNVAGSRHPCAGRAAVPSLQAIRDIRRDHLSGRAHARKPGLGLRLWRREHHGPH